MQNVKGATARFFILRFSFFIFHFSFSIFHYKDVRPAP